MSVNPILLISGFLYESCVRTEEGLPLPPNPIIIAILESVFARAQSKYPVVICHYLVMSNHIHLLYVVQDPEKVPRFMCYLKRELAHAVNHLRGRHKHTIFEEDYDPIAILDAEQAIKRIVYFLTNPQKAHLVDRIEDYPGLSSWEALISGDTKNLKRRRINRDSIEALPGRTLSLEDMRRIASSFTSKDQTEYVFTVEPNAWMKCFDETKDTEPTELNQEIVELIRAEESYFRSERKGKPVLGAHALVLQPMDIYYQPKKYAPRMLCLSTYKELRIAFLSWFREHISSLADGILPSGCFLPGGKLCSNVNPIFVPCANTFIFP